MDIKLVLLSAFLLFSACTPSELEEEPILSCRHEGRQFCEVVVEDCDLGQKKEMEGYVCTCQEVCPPTLTCEEQGQKWLCEKKDGF